MSIGSRRVTRVLERIIAERGAPKALRCDNGPEFTSRHFLAWCEQRGITLILTNAGLAASVGSTSVRLPLVAGATCSLRNRLSAAISAQVPTANPNQVSDNGQRNANFAPQNSSRGQRPRQEVFLAKAS